MPETTSAVQPGSRPIPLSVLPGSIPRQLKEHQQWVCWRYELPPGKAGNPEDWKKPPFDPHSLIKAGIKGIRRWGTFEDAMNLVKKGTFEGLGWVLGYDLDITTHLRVTCLDIDDCIDLATGAVKEWAMAIVRRFNSYTEVTPSGTGLHIWFLARLPLWRKVWEHGEIYNHGGYVTVTGHHLKGTPTTLKERHEEAHAFCQEYIPQAEASASIAGDQAEAGDQAGGQAETSAGSATSNHASGQAGDQASAGDPPTVDWVRLKVSQMRSSYGAYIRGLGDAKEEPIGTRSTNDIKFLFGVAYFTGPRPGLLKAVWQTYRRWGLKRTDDGYVDGTVAKVIAERKEYYSPGRSRGQNTSAKPPLDWVARPYCSERVQNGRTQVGGSERSFGKEEPANLNPKLGDSARPSPHRNGHSAGLASPPPVSSRSARPPPTQGNGEQAEQLHAGRGLGQRADGDQAERKNPEEVELEGFRASELTEGQTEWLWKDRLPMNTAAFLQGVKCHGKSTVARMIAAYVTGGPLLPGIQGEPRFLGDVLWFAGEENLHNRVLPGLRVAGADLGHCHLFTALTPDERRLMLPSGLGKLARLVRHHHAKLVVVDPIFAFNDGTFNLEGPTADSRGFMRKILTFAADEGVLVLFTRNVIKGTKMSALDAGRGGGELGNAARSVLHLGRFAHSRNLYGLAVAACNDGEDVPTLVYEIRKTDGHGKIVHVGEQEVTADELLGGAEALIDRTLKDKAKRLLRTVIGNEWIDSRTIKAKAEGAMIKPSTLYAAFVELGCDWRQTGTRGEMVTEWGPPVGGWK